VQSKVLVWRSATLLGAITLVAAQSSMCADYAFKGGIALIDEHFGAFLIAALGGMIVCLIGLLGWGVSSTKSACAAIGAVALLASVAVCALGSLVGGTNVHGPFYLIFLPMVLTSLSGIALLLIAAFRRSPRQA
jgi:hypothetical protein